MNYFEFYNIAVSFNIDMELLKKEFYAKSKAYHPDFFVNETDEKQGEMLDLSTYNNKAFKTLSDPELRLEYILLLKGLISEDEKYVLPQDFLMEMMDINEKLMELELDKDDKALTEIRSEVGVIENEINDHLLSSLMEFDNLKDPSDDAILLTVKDLYYRKKYLLRIKDSLNKFASP